VPRCFAADAKRRRLIVRVRPQSAGLRPRESGALADAARQFGNGHIDLTRRAKSGRFGRARSVAFRFARCDRGSRIARRQCGRDEAVRNIMVNPLAGIDATEACDVRPIAGELARWLTSDGRCGRCRPSLVFIVDGGGALFN